MDDENTAGEEFFTPEPAELDPPRVCAQCGLFYEVHEFPFTFTGADTIFCSRWCRETMMGPRRMVVGVAYPELDPEVYHPRPPRTAYYLAVICFVLFTVPRMPDLPFPLTLLAATTALAVIADFCTRLERLALLVRTRRALRATKREQGGAA